MLPSLIVVIGVALAFIVWFVREKRIRLRKMSTHSIGPDSLHQLLASNDEPTVLDVRVPLDLLAYSQMIPGARRIPLQGIIANPNVIPKDRDYVLYCTCPGDESSLKVLHRALSMGVREGEGSQGRVGWLESSPFLQTSGAGGPRGCGAGTSSTSFQAYGSEAFRRGGAEGTSMVSD